MYTNIDKSERLLYGDTAMDHAMVFTAVSLDVSLFNLIYIFYLTTIIHCYFLFMIFLINIHK